MGNELEFSLDRIGRIASAVNLIGDNTLLDGKLSYRLGILGDNCASPLKIMEKERNKRIKVSNENRKTYAGKKTGDKAKDDLIDGEIGMLNNDLATELADLGDEKQKIKVPDFKLSEFLTKEETKQVVKTKDKDGVDKNEIIIIKAGSALVPVRFFTLMGDLIKEE